MIRAIETCYKGYRFRSRLEARWAVFFDALNLDWRYESEGFHLGNGMKYLPDFWIQNIDSWIEIKPTGQPSEEEREKARRLADGTGDDVYILYGDVWSGAYGAIHFLPQMGAMDDSIGMIDGIMEWVIRELERSLSFFGATKHLTEDDDLEETLAYYAQLDLGQILRTAFTAARQARFEHGESPPP